MKETPSRDGNESINKNSRVRSMVSWYNHSSHRNTINIWFFSDTNWWHGSRKKCHTKNSFVNSRWSVWTFTKKKEFLVKNRTNIFWYIWRLSWSFTKSNRRSSCFIRSKILFPSWNRHESMINKTTWAICVAVSVFFLTERTLFLEGWCFLFFLLFSKGTWIVWLHWWIPCTNNIRNRIKSSWFHF